MTPRKTKIICTIGPAVSGIDNLTKLIDHGMDIARLNFSHGTRDTHKSNVDDIREASKHAGRRVSILQDLQGPKIRTGKVENSGVMLEDGQYFIITTDEIEIGNSEKVSTVYKNLSKEVKPGNTILLDDGYIILLVQSIKKNDILTKVVKGGILKDNKGIITPGATSMAPSLSDKDMEDFKFGLSVGIDAVALSFVRSERDILELKTVMKIFGRTVPIIAKIERYEGYESIDRIIEEADCIMVARGDLGLEMPAESVPIIQKEIIKKCNEAGKPVIIATQMLESMIENPRPTRAEASDVANAVIDQTDCVMLSAETSIGKYPFDAVEYMRKIIGAVEEKYNLSNLKVEFQEDSGNNDICDALAKASFVVAGQINAKAIVCLTSTGSTASKIAKYRPVMPIIAFTDNELAHSKMTFTKGVYPKLIDKAQGSLQVYSRLKEYLSDIKFLNQGDKIVFVAGLSSENVYKENLIRIILVGDE
jgi:pyruvate kinase